MTEVVPGRTRRILVSFDFGKMRRELSLYALWFNEFRPHRALGGRTPAEVYDEREPANRKPRIEPRSKYPEQSPCAAPQAPVRGPTGVKLRLIVSFLEGRKHLPIVELKQAA